MNIFEKNDRIYPLDYPHLIKYAEAIQDGFWTHKHFTYERDVKDFKTQLSNVDMDIVKKCMLSIGVVENKVKAFWPNIHQRMPKTEISDVAFTFGGNEVVHRRTYEQTLKLLNLQSEFETIHEVDCMKDRIAYLTKYLEGSNSRDNKEFTKSLILFTMFMENSTLFMYFLLISSYNKYKNLMGNFNTIITATAKEEMLHGKFGSELINIIKKENPSWFDKEMEEKIRRNVRKAFKAESKVIDWVMEKGEPTHISKQEVLEFLKIRLNNSLVQIGYTPEYIIDANLAKKSEYMETMLLSTITGDFFDTKVTDYNESVAITEDSLWAA